MATNPAALAAPEPLKHPHSHYWKTTKTGRIIESWVLTKDSEGKTVREVDLVHPKTGERKRERVRGFDKLPAVVRIASGGARMGGGRARDEEGEVEEGGGGGGERGKKKMKKKCVVM